MRITRVLDTLFKLTQHIITVMSVIGDVLKRLLF